MFLDLENLSIEELLQKQIEIRKRMMQARSMSPAVINQLENMLNQVLVQLQTTIAKEKLNSEKEKASNEGKDLDNPLNIE